MDGFNSNKAGGSLQISTEVLEKIAKHAAMEVEGVVAVSPAIAGAKTLIDKISQPRAVAIDIKNDVADITISLTVAYGTKIPDISERVQASIKEAVQNMTSISVARVDVVVAGLAGSESA